MCKKASGKKTNKQRKFPSDRRAWAIILLYVIIWLPTSCSFWIKSHPAAWKNYSIMSQILPVHKLFFYSRNSLFSLLFSLFLLRTGVEERVCGHLPSSCPSVATRPQPHSPLPAPCLASGSRPCLLRNTAVCPGVTSSVPAPLPSAIVCCSKPQ